MHKQTIHLGIKDYACETCEKRFKDAYSLKAHELTHTGIKPYACDLCEKSFTSNSNLEKHKRSIHQGIRPHACSMCERTFPNASSLRRHMLSHTGERPYTCSMCQITFIRLTDLKTHEQECNQMETTETIGSTGTTETPIAEAAPSIKVEPGTLSSWKYV